MERKEEGDTERRREMKMVLKVVGGSREKVVCSTERERNGRKEGDGQERERERGGRGRRVCDRRRILKRK